METSDSEYFESADEEFFSDDDYQDKQLTETKISKIQKLSISEKENRKVGTTNETKDDSKTSLTQDVKDVKQDTSDSDITLSENTWNDEVSVNTETEFKSTQSKIDKPPGVTSCWEPGMDYIEEPELKTQRPPGVEACWEPGVDYFEEPNRKNDIAPKVEVAKSKRPEFGIPPARVTCWVDGVNTPTSTHLKKPEDAKPPINKKERGFSEPPAIEGCWEEGVNTTKQKTNLKKPEDAKPPIAKKDRGFSEPPAIERCWEEGVNTTKQKTNLKKPEDAKPPINKKERGFSEPPAIERCWEEGVNTTKQRSSSLKKPEDTKDQKDRGFSKPPAMEECWEEGINTLQKSKPDKPKQPIKEEEKEFTKPSTMPLRSQTPEETNPSNPEENMWEDDDWKNFDIASKPTKKLSEDMWKDDSNWEPIAETTGSSTSVDPKPTEDNMWGEDDDWNSFDTAKPEAKKEEDNMWEDDDWEPIENIPKHNENKPPIETKEDSGWGAWGSWGLSSVLSTASTLTNQVSQSITTVIESGIGAPDPEQLARINNSNEKEMGEQSNNQEKPQEKPMMGFGLGNIVQGVTKLVETTGTKVITGGLDTLETIGKKTMEVLQENDPGLKKKRAFLKLDDNKPILSHVLREAKENSDHVNQGQERKHATKKPNYEALFDDHQGLVHLEALEMLSKQCDIKLCGLLDSSNGEALLEMQETMDQVKELCELPEDEEEESLGIEEVQEKLESAVSDLNIKITYDRMVSTWREVEDWLDNINLTEVNCKVIHKKAIETLAQLTAIAVEQFHKAGELLLVKDHRSTADEADALVQLTTTLSAFIGTTSGKFSENLNMTIEHGATKEEVNGLITNVFFEAANSSSYIQDAFQLLIPVLQVGAV